VEVDAGVAKPACFGKKSGHSSLAHLGQSWLVQETGQAAKSDV